MFVSRWFTISDEESWFCSRFSVSFFIFSFSSSCNPALPGATGVCLCVLCVCYFCYFCFVFVWCWVHCNSVAFSVLIQLCIYLQNTGTDVTELWPLMTSPSWTMSSANTQTCKPQRIPHYRALEVTLLERLEKEYKNFWLWFNDLEKLCIYLDLRRCAATDACLSAIEF